MLALFVFGLFVLPSAVILLVATRATPARATRRRDPERR
jgi:hypothetical protein